MVDKGRAGAAAWIASGVLIPVQLVVASQWPDGYSATSNAISDLGVTGCGQFSEHGQQVRDVCSPWHSIFNAGMVVSGALIAVGAVLLHGRWEGRSGRGGTILMAAGGLLVAVVGFAPWDTQPDLHDSVALGGAVAQWGAMGLLAAAAGPGRFRWLTTVAAAVSVVGFVAFLTALEGAEVPGLGFGLAERLSFDTLTLWTVLVGVALQTGHRPSITRSQDGSSIATHAGAS